MAHIDGDNLNNTIVGTAAADLIHAYGGNDLVLGRDGDDRIFGMNGDDTLYGQNGDDTIDGGSGEDRIFGGDDNDTIDGGSGDDYLRGGDGNDTIRGNSGTNTVYGDAGHDVIYSSGYGVYDGGIGNDTIHAAAGTPETLRGGFGIDTLITTHWGSNYTINLGTGATNYAGESFTGFENLRAGAGSDTLTGTNVRNVMFGGDGNDTINGLLGNDSLYGQDGNDTINGGLGDDYISGGDDNDVLRGGGGTDSVYGGNGNDVIYSSGRGVYDGGAGEDTIYAAAGTPETLRGGSGVDMLDTTSWNGDYEIRLPTGVTNYPGESFTGFENVRTGSGNDKIVGDMNDNRFYGNNGDDKLLSNKGDDTLFGGNGDDLMRGGRGADDLYGGSGSDTFDFNKTVESSGSSVDSIYGFDGAGINLFGATADRIDLRGIDARENVGGNQAFTFIGVASDGAPKAAGSLWVHNSGTNTYLHGSTDNDDAAEFTVVIRDGAGTDASDYWSGDFYL